jgi:hypothetical protein
MHATETFFSTVAGVIATLLVALAFGWQPSRQRPLGRFGIAFAYTLMISIFLALFVAIDGMAEVPAVPNELAFYFTQAVVSMLLLALVFAFANRGEDFDDDRK